MYHRILVGLLTLGLAACKPHGWERRYGPDPILNAAAIETAGINKNAILDALAADARIVVGTPESWYYVAEAGFNYVDDECQAYFNDLFFLNREKDRVKSGLSAAGQTTSAILAVTGAASPTLAIVAQAFGFAVSATDIVASSYLYQLPPSATLTFVKELQNAYREGAAAQRGSINTPASAYHHVQQYLALCLPSTIEAKLIEHISGARAFHRIGRASTVAVGVTSAPPKEIISNGPVTSRAPIRPVVVAPVTPVIRRHGAADICDGPDAPLSCPERRPAPQRRRPGAADITGGPDEPLGGR